MSEILDAATIVDSGNSDDLIIKSVCSADMMSDVLYYHSPNSLLLTGLTQPHVVTTAEIAGIKVIIFVLSKRPDSRTVELARQKKIPLFSTPYCMYTASGKLYEAGLRSLRDR
ncbi:MAG: hypothetical protein C4526_07205 [Nitrospiraceae bacterium]|nr:MAG: hypothetical protein C4526_07205 [Nitrospiraceae bacterium]